MQKSTTATAVLEADTSQPTMEERRALLGRIGNSAQFRRAARARDFLNYVGGESLKDDTREIHEQEIGSKVFGRDSAYDRSQDNIVRVSATDLRRRIDTYFSTEGVDEPIVVEIPRGGYKPVFRWRSASSPVTQPEDTIDAGLPIHPSAAPQSPSRNRLGWLATPAIWMVTTALLATVCLVLLHQGKISQSNSSGRDNRPVGPTVAAFWKGFAEGSEQTDIVLPDASVSIREEIVGNPMSLSNYVNHTYISPADESTLSSDRRADLKRIFQHNLVAFGDFQAAEQILRFNPTTSPMHIVMGRFFSADSVKRDGLILIGGEKANPWVRLFSDQMNFALIYNDQGSQGLIENRHPLAGEQSQYIANADANRMVGFSAITYMASPSHAGNIIVIAGTDSDATDAAAEFLTSEQRLDSLRKLLKVNTFPHFELLLKSTRLSGAAFKTDIVAYRTYPEKQ